DETVFVGDFGYKRTNFTLSINHQSKDNRFALQANVQKSSQRNKLMATDFTSQIFLAPNAPALYDEQGNLNWENNTFENPLSKLNATYLAEIDDMGMNVQLKYLLTPNLEMKVNTGLSDTGLAEFKTVPHTIYNPAYGLTSANSSLMQTRSKRKNWIVEPQLSW